MEKSNVEGIFLRRILENAMQNGISGVEMVKILPVSPQAMARN
jgi:hypothetical protein